MNQEKGKVWLSQEKVLKMNICAKAGNVFFHTNTQTPGLRNSTRTPATLCRVRVIGSLMLHTHTHTHVHMHAYKHARAHVTFAYIFQNARAEDRSHGPLRPRKSSFVVQESDAEWTRSGPGPQN